VDEDLSKVIDRNIAYARRLRRENQSPRAGKR
jgi:hypothetical protein